ncbi:histidine kinase group protein [Colletotrichum karsti]|uniref:Histidine kinase group protein n=1 Tax=Colletotrichum karsti TaxID=1095194 RepID=A0A9P6HW38_9PEZI|nr:histidine kinase group protein [Colletotrichum karsti]KAF9869346.1 histidine kinase group protein [Colletotrichum karsti]
MHPPPLLGVGVVDLLESDPRPSFVVTLPASFKDSLRAEVIYNNPALTSKPALLEVLQSISSLDHTRFWDWITAQDATSPSFLYNNHFWTRNVVLNRWVVVSSNDFPPMSEPPRKIRLDGSRGREASSGILHPHASTVPSMSSADSSEEDLPHPRIVRATTEPPLVLPDFMPDQEPFLDMIDSVNWSSTPLGPMDSWPSMLHQSYSQILCNSQPTAIYWGPKFTTVYNEAYGEMIGSRHPNLLGRSVTEVFPEIANQLKDMMENPGQSRRSSSEEEFCFFVEQPEGPPLETYLKWSLVPVIHDNQCLGFIHLISDTTMYHLFRRRIQMLVDMGEELGTAKDVKSYWSKLIEELSECDPAYDIPLAMLYSIERAGSDAGSESRHDFEHICRLEGALGIPKNHPIMPETLRLKETDAGLASQYRAALRSHGPLIIRTSDGSLPKDLLTGLQWRGFGDPCEAAIVLPIRPTKEEEVMGLLVLGLNPRRPYDDAYNLYIQLLAQKLTTSLACTVLLEEERRRGRNAAEQAAYDQAMLKEKLAYQTKEVIEYTRLFQTVSDFIPNGFSIGDHQGNITFANNLWYRITGYPDNQSEDGGAFSFVLEVDREKIREAYKELRIKDEVEFEFRVQGTEHTNGLLARRSPFKADLYSELDNKLERYVMAQAKAERAMDGTIIRTFTCLTDVTAHKRTADEATRRTQQAQNLKRMAELATVGMFDIDTGGRLLGANNAFFELCGIEKVDLTQHEVRPWQTSVAKEDLPILTESLNRLVSEKKPQTAEIRLNTTWTAEDAGGNLISAPRWVNATFMPVSNSDGVVQSFTGCISDVSLQKWQLETETRRTEEAIDSKRQQDNFIDMTSHEMRNPLSAIVHCSDAIIASLARCEELANRPSSPILIKSPPEEDNGKHFDMKQLLSDSIENAETIVACAQHQKRIVDDILTMSKLDSKLLAVTPCTVNPVQIGEEAIKMFDVEARRVDIDLNMKVDKSYRELGFDYLDLDPSRVKQVLINLLTNALKFTKSGSIRNVSVCMKASRQRPTDETSAVTFIPRSCHEESEYEQPALEGRRDPIYLMFEVKDTGQGLSEDEKANLFNRFVQASSRTHVKYGGSGLGLFISRRLTELQKGAIGVSSLPGVGSTFAFFVEAYVPSEASRREAESAAAAVRATTLAIAATTPISAPRIRSPTKEQRTPGSQVRPRSHDPRLDGILVVEDNLINQQITRRGLQDRGFTVDVANHGIEALERLMQSISLQQEEEQEYFSSSLSSVQGPPVPINLILMDIEMPIQDGLTCTRRIRELEHEGRVFCASGGRIPIIAVSANARPEQMQQAKSAGCDDVLVKPYRMPELIEKMQVVVRRMGGLSPGSPIL